MAAIITLLVQYPINCLTSTMSAGGIVIRCYRRGIKQGGMMLSHEFNEGLMGTTCSCHTSDCCDEGRKDFIIDILVNKTLLHENLAKFINKHFNLFLVPFLISSTIFLTPLSTFFSAFLPASSITSYKGSGAKSSKAPSLRAFFQLGQNPCCSHGSYQWSSGKQS